MSFTADPTSVLDYAFDWSAWLDDGETITASTWKIPARISQTTPASSIDGSLTTVWLTGGAIGHTYKIPNHITTSAGRQEDRSFDLEISDL